MSPVPYEVMILTSRLWSEKLLTFFKNDDHDRCDETCVIPQVAQLANTSEPYSFLATRGLKCQRESASRDYAL